MLDLETVSSQFLCPSLPAQSHEQSCFQSKFLSQASYREARSIVNAALRKFRQKAHGESQPHRKHPFTGRLQRTSTLC